jgi:hypothetical protein
MNLEKSERFPKSKQPNKEISPVSYKVENLNLGKFLSTKSSTRIANFGYGPSVSKTVKDGERLGYT